MTSAGPPARSVPRSGRPTIVAGPMVVGPDDLGERQPELEEPRHRRRQVDDRSFDRVAMEVGADGVGHQALGQRLVGRLPREASAAVTDIEPDAALRGAMRLRHDPAIAAADPRPRRGEGMGDDVARSHPLEGRRDVGAVRDVGHQRDAGEGRRLERRVERGRHVGPARLGPEADLHPDDDVAMVRDDRRGLARTRDTRMSCSSPTSVVTRPAAATWRKARTRTGARFDGVPAKRREVREAGRPGVDGGRHAAGEVDDRVDAVGARVGPVAVEVDQAGSHDQPRHVDDAVVGRRAPPCRSGRPPRSAHRR